MTVLDSCENLLPERLSYGETFFGKFEVGLRVFLIDFNFRHWNHGLECKIGNSEGQQRRETIFWKNFYSFEFCTDTKGVQTKSKGKFLIGAEECSENHKQIVDVQRKLIFSDV